ncbi:glycosyltransferase family 2 protein [Roseovarius sp. M141]|uniref:glycosyltransferase family 2 protein n=1 Tax=Roseovarius sp. M141 TaxID=2583806 RepID=UPI0020CC36B2|nr:glycosyltransferase family 2 protein [Roseovarius sp. M141]MCQ0092519.1 glycosyltransferase family 2 protein [Roseovarius sp. M141]
MHQSNAAERVTIVTVAYNSSAVLADMLASVPAQTPVVIFDNASQDRPKLRELVAARENKTQLIESDRNLGFGTGCNKGAEAAETEFLLFLNPDTALFPDTLQNLVLAADRRPDISAFNPRILNDDGTSILKRRSDLVPRGAWVPRGELTQDTILPVLSGAAFFVRRADFNAVGGFDTKIFLFFEDDDLSVRLSAARGNLMYVHDAKVSHIGGASSGWSPKSEKLKNWHWGFSQIYTARKHGMRLACLGAVLKTGIRALSPATLLSSKRRLKYAARLRGMAGALRWGGARRIRT